MKLKKEYFDKCAKLAKLRMNDPNTESILSLEQEFDEIAQNMVDEINMLPEDKYRTKNELKEVSRDIIYKQISEDITRGAKNLREWVDDKSNSHDVRWFCSENENGEIQLLLQIKIDDWMDIASIKDSFNTKDDAGTFVERIKSNTGLDLLLE